MREIVGSAAAPGCQLHEFAAEEFHPRPPCMIPS
jgi:hypothetical protein